MGNVMLELDTKTTRLCAELEAVVGDDPALVAACDEVAWWAVVREDPRVITRFVSQDQAPEQLCRRGLVEGRAYDLQDLAFYADSMERIAAALRLLIGHTEATNPRARRRRRKQSA